MGGIFGKKSNPRQPQMLNKLVTKIGSTGISQCALGGPSQKATRLEEEEEY